MCGVEGHLGVLRVFFWGGCFAQWPSAGTLQGSAKADLYEAPVHKKYMDSEQQMARSSSESIQSLCVAVCR